MAVRRVQKMGERRLAHPRRPIGDSGRVRPRWHPQIPLERLVQEECAELLASPQKVKHVRQSELVVYLGDKSPISNYFGCHSCVLALTSSWISKGKSGKA